MAVPVNDSYSCESGAGIYGGRYKWPSWRRAMSPNTWGTIPGNVWNDVNPANDPLINPNYSGLAPWNAANGFASLVTAYCGGCWDDETSTFWSPLNGGHNDYAGNEPYKNCLMSDSPQWVMLRNPSGAIGNEITLNDGQEATGLYADGRVRSTHGYNKLVFIPGVGPAVVQVGGTYSNSSGGKTKRAVLIDPVTGEMTRWGSENPDAGLVVDDGGGCYDENRHALWWKGPGTCKFSWYDIDTDTWTPVGSSVAIGGGVGMVYIPEHDCILWANKNLTNNIGIFDCATGLHYQPNVTGTAVGITDIWHRSPPTRIKGTNTFAVWDNDLDSTVINTLTFDGDPRTATWQIAQLPLSGDNAVTPSIRTVNGTNGRFFYSSKLDGFGLLNSVNEPFYFYARS